MNYQKNSVLPEEIEAKLTEFYQFQKNLYNLLIEHYEQQVKNDTDFYRKMVDLCLQSRFPFFYHLHSAYGTTTNACILSWRTQIQKSLELSLAELEYLKAQCTKALVQDECPVAKLLHMIDMELEPSLRQDQCRLQEIQEDGLDYREGECNRMLNRLTEHTQRRAEWVQELLANPENSEETQQALVRVVADTATNNDERNDQFLAAIEESKREFEEFVQIKAGQTKKAIQVAADDCAELIDRRVNKRICGSNELVRELDYTHKTAIANFKTTAEKFMEELSGRLLRSQDEVRHPWRPDATTEFIDDCQRSLRLTESKLQSALGNAMIRLNGHRMEERVEIRKELDAEKEAHEKFLVHEKSTDRLYPEVDLANYDSVILGSGAQGQVVRYELPAHLFEKDGDKTDTKTMSVAAKRFIPRDRDDPSHTRHTTDSGNDEVLTLFKLVASSEHILQFLGRGFIGVDRFLLVEYCPQSLADLIAQPTNIDALMFVCLARGIAEGMRHLHREIGFHGDLKPPNILIGEGLVAKIADFGLADVTISKGKSISYHKGTLRYMAPEQHRGETLTVEREMKKCDVWSFGLVVWEMMTLLQPFPQFNEDMVQIQIARGAAICMPDEFHCESLNTLLLKCWSENNSRPSFRDVCGQLEDVAEELQEMVEKPGEWEEECRNYRVAAHSGR